jgi:hypothetical protein
MALADEKTSLRILHIMLQRIVYQIMKNLLHQVFDPHGAVETIEIFPARSRIVAFIKKWKIPMLHELLKACRDRTYMMVAVN